MKKRDIMDTLTHLGLTAAEANLYLWLVEHLQATGYEASKALKVPRATTYLNLESLVEKNLVHSNIQNKKRIYVPESFSVWKKNIDERSELVTKLLPALDSLLSVKQHPIDVRVYHGVAGLQKAWDEVIEHFERESVRTCYAVSHGSQVYAIMPRYFHRWIERRISNKTEALLIYPFDDKEAVTNGSIAESLAHYKFVQGSALAFSGDVTCGGKITALFSLDHTKESHAVIIESEDIARIISQWFLTMWHVLPNEEYRFKK